MSTGGIALTLSLTPHRFRGLDTIGLVVFLFDLLCFILITACLLLRFLLYKHTFRKTLTHPKEVSSSFSNVLGGVFGGVLRDVLGGHLS